MFQRLGESVALTLREGVLLGALAGRGVNPGPARASFIITYLSSDSFTISNIFVVIHLGQTDRSRERPW